MKKYLSQLVLGVALLASCNPVIAGAIDEAVKRGALRVGTNPSYLPFQMTDKRGQIIGFEIDLLREMTQALGVRLELVPGPYEALIPGLLANKFDIISSGMTVTQARNLQLNFSDSFIIVGQTLLIRPEMVDRVLGVDDLDASDYRIGAVKGTTGEWVVKNRLGKARLLSYSSAEQGVAALVLGNVDSFIHDAPSNLISMTRVGEDKLVHLEQPFSYEPLAFGLKKGDHDSLNWINNFLNQIAEDGTYDRLHDRWFRDADWLTELGSAP